MEQKHVVGICDTTILDKTEIFQIMNPFDIYWLYISCCWLQSGAIQSVKIMHSNILTPLYGRISNRCSDDSHLNVQQLSLRWNLPYSGNKVHLILSCHNLMLINWISCLFYYLHLADKRVTAHMWRKYEGLWNVFGSDEPMNKCINEWVVECVSITWGHGLDLHHLLVCV